MMEENNPPWSFLRFGGLGDDKQWRSITLPWFQIQRGVLVSVLKDSRFLSIYPVVGFLDTWRHGVIRIHSLLPVAGLVFLFSFPASGTAVEEQLVVGAGPSTKIVGLFFARFFEIFAAKGYSFTVPPRSAKHAGGIKASGTYLFGRTGRPLNEEEKAQNKEEIFLARIPIAFATGTAAGVSHITLEQLRDLFTRRISNWREVDGAAAPVYLVGREKTEALFTILRNAYPFFDRVRFDRVFTRDHQVVNFLKAPAGGNALAFGALPNLEALNLLVVSDFETGVSVGLVYDRSNRNHPLVQTVRDLSRSDAWHETVVEAGYLPPL